MKYPIVFDCYYEYDIPDWKRKKAEMEKHLSGEYTLLNKDISEFHTDRYSKRNYFDQFFSIFSETINEFCKDLGVDDIHINDIWSVKYEKGEWHSPHTHGNVNMSACLYFDYDEEDHTPTHFIVNSVNSAGNTSLMSSAAKEGRLIIFPATLLHFTSPNKSDKPRRVISFDISFKRSN